MRQIRLALTAGVAAALALASVRPSSADPAVFTASFLFPWGASNAVAPDGSMLVTGWTGETFQATPGAWDTSYDVGDDAVAMRVDATGRLIWATYIGGAGHEHGRAIASGPDGSAYVTGIVHASEDADGNPETIFPTTEGALNGDYTRPPGQEIAWVVKLAPDGSSADWVTLLPGMRSVDDLEIDADGQTHFVGEAYPDLPTTPGAFDVTAGPEGWETDGAVGVLSADGSRYEHVSFLGGSDFELMRQVEVGPRGSTYLSGLTDSDDLPGTEGSYQPQKADWNPDAFVARVSGDGELEWSTYLGGTGGDRFGVNPEVASGLAVDQQGSVVISGFNPRSDFPVTEDAAWPTMPSGYASWVARISADGTSLLWSTFLPGAVEEAHTDRQGHVHLLSQLSTGLVEGDSPLVLVELDRQGGLRTARPGPDLYPGDFDVDAAGSSYILAIPPVSRVSAGEVTLTRIPNCTIYGTPGDDVLSGTDGPDVICAGAGDDVVDSFGGADVLILGRGDDRGAAGSGVDVARGGPGRDTLLGQDDRDLLYGSSGVDRLFGGEGDDTLIGGRGEDVERGGPGLDD